MNKGHGLFWALVGALVLAWWSTSTPKPMSAQAPAAVFSAGRAMIDDRVISRAPHPVGSVANAAARDYLLGRMRDMGLSPQIQHEDAMRRVARAKIPVIEGAGIENVIGVLPGRDPKLPALAIMAHYDSVPNSPGAADDALGVSTAFEVVRALKAQGTPDRDVVLLITDGEEAGLVGAYGFYHSNPLAKHVGLVMNMDSRGGGGSAQMYQTGPQNGQMIDLFRRTAVKPSATSLSSFISERLPNDSDFTMAKAFGYTGLNYAFIGRQFDYHSITSTADVLDQGTVQHMGDQVLSAAHAIAFSSALPGKALNVVFSNVFGSLLVAYPPEMGWVVLALAAALLGFGVYRANRTGHLEGVDIARGLGAAIYLVATAIVFFRFARRLTGAGFGFFEQRQLLAVAHRWEFALLLIGFGALFLTIALATRHRSRIPAALTPLIVGAACSLFGLDIPGLAIGAGASVLGLAAFGQPAGIAGGWAGVLITGLLVAIGLQAIEPLTAFVVAWPLTIAAFTAALLGLGVAPLPLGRALSWGLALATTAWVLGYGHNIHIALDLVEALALFVWLGALVLWPLVHSHEDQEDSPPGWAITFLVLGLGLTLVLRLHAPWSERYPRATLVSYAVDVDHAQAHRISVTPDLSPWAEKVLRADGGKLTKLALPILTEHPVTAALAAPVQVAVPQISFARQADGSYLLTAAPPPGAQTLYIDLRSKTRLDHPTINGKAEPILDQPDQWTKLRLVAVPRGVTVGFRAAQAGEIEVVYGSLVPTWPAGAKPLPERDAKTMPFDRTDSTFTYGTKRFTW